MARRSQRLEGAGFYENTLGLERFQRRGTIVYKSGNSMVLYIRRNTRHESARRRVAAATT